MTIIRGGIALAEAANRWSCTPVVYAGTKQATPGCETCGETVDRLTKCKLCGADLCSPDCGWEHYEVMHEADDYATLRDEHNPPDPGEGEDY